MFFQYYISGCVSRSGNVDVLQRKWKWFFCRQVQFDTWYNEIVQKSLLASLSSRAESSWNWHGVYHSSEFPWRNYCSSPRSGRSRVKVDVLSDAFLCFFQHYVQWRTRCSGNVDVLYRNKKWFFFRHVQFDSGYNVMTIKEFSCGSPEVTFSFLIITGRVFLKLGWSIPFIWLSLKKLLFFSFWTFPG